ncbi:8399_t:CDS:2, partial [Racocetra fulgida]
LEENKCIEWTRKVDQFHGTAKQTVDPSPVVTHPTIEITSRLCQEQQVKVQEVYVASVIEDSEEKKHNDSYSVNSLTNKETQSTEAPPFCQPSADMNHSTEDKADEYKASSNPQESAAMD